MKKLMLVISVLAAVLSFTACGKQELVGMDKIEALRDYAASCESGCYIIRNTENDEIEQTFTFMYDTDDTQIYYCEGYDSDGYYAEYSNGKELFRERNGEGSVIPSTDESYASYTKKEPHPYSTGQLFFYVNSYVASAEETTDSEGNTLYIYSYDTGRLNKSLKTSLTEFATSYAFDSNGDFVYFRQVNSDGSGTYSYGIEIENLNSITSIENPITVTSESSEP